MIHGNNCSLNTVSIVYELPPIGSPVDFSTGKHAIQQISRCVSSYKGHSSQTQQLFPYNSEPVK